MRISPLSFKKAGDRHPPVLFLFYTSRLLLPPFAIHGERQREVAALYSSSSQLGLASPEEQSLPSGQCLTCLPPCVQTAGPMSSCPRLRQPSHLPSTNPFTLLSPLPACPPLPPASHLGPHPTKPPSSRCWPTPSCPYPLLSICLLLGCAAGSLPIPGGGECGGGNCSKETGHIWQGESP